MAGAPFEISRMIHSLELDHEKYLASLKKSEDELIRFNSSVERSVREQKGYWGSLAAGVQESMSKVGQSLLGPFGARTSTGQGLGLFDKIKADAHTAVEAVKSSMKMMKDTYLDTAEDMYKDPLAGGLLGLRRDTINAEKEAKRTARMEDVREKHGLAGYDTGMDETEEITRRAKQIGKSQTQIASEDYAKQLEDRGITQRNPEGAKELQNERDKALALKQQLETQELIKNVTRDIDNQTNQMSDAWSEIDKHVATFEENLRKTNNYSEVELKDLSDQVRPHYEIQQDEQRSREGKRANQDYDDNKADTERDALKDIDKYVKSITDQTALMNSNWNEIDKAVAALGQKLENEGDLNETQIQFAKDRVRLAMELAGHERDIADLEDQEERRRSEGNRSYDAALGPLKQLQQAIEDNKEGMDDGSRAAAAYARHLEETGVAADKADMLLAQYKNTYTQRQGQQLTRANEKPEERFKREAAELAKMRVQLGPDFEETYRRQTAKQIKDYNASENYVGPEAGEQGGSLGGQSLAVSRFKQQRMNMQDQRALAIARDAMTNANTTVTGGNAPTGGPAPPDKDDKQVTLLGTIADYLKQILEQAGTQSEGDHNVSFETADLN